MSTYSEKGGRSTTITKDNWRDFGRSKLAVLGQKYPSLLEVALKVYDMHKYVFGDDLSTVHNPKMMTELEQAQKFKYVVYSEGACGWADRLKKLMLYNSTIFLQSTPCHEYYQDLMEPYVHYIPVKGNFDDLPEKVMWANEHPKEAATIATNALQLQRKLLSSSSIRKYMHQIFYRYSRLIKYRLVKRQDAIREWSLPLKVANASNPAR